MGSDATEKIGACCSKPASIGNPVAQWGNSSNPYRFAGAWGYRDDGDAGLLYIGARYYELAVGRWTSADKWLGNLYQPLSLNRYLYCEDDLVNHVDPSGNIPSGSKTGRKRHGSGQKNMRPTLARASA
ncbi:MAG: RHS repeat-associated core domain-containing protein [Firmicutes bacterium]|nr:RHS repeat-associated core domain-containing protein [Bacillota bacterium]